MKLSAMIGRHGLKRDVRGWHVTMSWRGRTLLGEIRAVRYRHVPAGFVVDVQHFNGEPWPLQPVPSALELLSRAEPLSAEDVKLNGMDDEAADYHDREEERT